MEIFAYNLNSEHATRKVARGVTDLFFAIDPSKSYEDAKMRAKGARITRSKGEVVERLVADFTERSGNRSAFDDILRYSTPDLWSDAIKPCDEEAARWNDRLRVTYDAERHEYTLWCHVDAIPTEDDFKELKAEAIRQIQRDINRKQ